MVAILTGDVIHSRHGEVEAWLTILKEVLNYYGEAPSTWEIFRGDSFQLSIVPEKAILVALHIKAAIKITKLQDVRIGIGIGEEVYKSSKISASNGSAYERSGICFESLKKQTLGINSGCKDFDFAINCMLSLSLITANNWSARTAEVIKSAIENPAKNQNELAKMLNKSQSSVSEALKRGGFEEIMRMNTYFKTQIVKQC